MGQCSSVPGKFCALAWLHRFTNIGGQVQVCCSSEGFANDILDDQGGKINIRDGLSDEQILNSKFMQDLRTKLLDGEWPELCRRCAITEETGGVSRRMNENQHHEARIPSLLAATRDNGELNSVTVRSADYRLGNLCNLACRMCSPHASTAWIKYAKGMANTDGSPRFAHLQTDIVREDWYEDDAFVAQVLKQANNLEHLHFGGGEPLSNPKMVPLLRACVEQGVAKNIKLTYNTNLTRISDSLRELWPQFNGVHLYCSVDAFGALNEFIRHPSRWSDIDKNLRDIDANFDRYGIHYAEVMTTTQIYNIFHLDDLFEYLFANMTRVNKLPKLLDLYTPSYLRTQILSPELKALAKSKLECLLRKSQDRIDQGLIAKWQGEALDTIKGAIGFLALEDRSHEISNFWQFTLSLDSLHRNRALQLIPELRKLAQPSPPELSL